MDQPFLTVAKTQDVEDFCQIEDNIAVFNPYGAKKHLGFKAKELALKVDYFKTRK